MWKAGVSRMSQISSNAHIDRIAAGTKNTAHVASIVRLGGTKIVRTQRSTSLGGIGALSFVMLMIAWPQSNAN